MEETRRHETLKKWKNSITALLVLALLVLASVFLRLFLTGKIDSVDALQAYMKQFGMWGPLVLTLFQMAQVVIPVLPGVFGYAAGTLLFGTFGGFLCNYIGISIGSFIAFFLARKFGVQIILLMFSEKKYEKWRAKIEGSKKYTRLLMAVILLPIFPDDFFCFFSGLIKMDLKKFVWIILLGKPWCLLAYSIFFGLF